MRQRPRHRFLALVCAVCVLVIQTAPALAVCRCEVPAGQSCCGAQPAPAATEHACCASSGSPPPSSTTLSGPDCHKDIVDVSLTALVTAPSTVDPHETVPVAAVTGDESGDVVVRSASAARGAPAMAHFAPAYLLHAALLI